MQSFAAGVAIDNVNRYDHRIPTKTIKVQQKCQNDICDSFINTYRVSVQKWLKPLQEVDNEIDCQTKQVISILKQGQIKCTKYQKLLQSDYF